MIAQHDDVLGVAALCRQGEVVTPGDRGRVRKLGIDHDDLVVCGLEVAVEPDVDPAGDQLREHILRHGTRLLAIGQHAHRDAAALGSDERLRDAPMGECVCVDENLALRPVDGGDDESVDGVARREGNLDVARRRESARRADNFGRHDQSEG